MDKKKILARIKGLYETNGINIVDYLKSIDSREQNTLEDILISYDFQAGSYIDEYKTNPQYKFDYVTRLANIIDGLDCNKRNIFECGIGEATIMMPLASRLKTKILTWGGRHFMVKDENGAKVYGRI